MASLADSVSRLTLLLSSPDTKRVLAILANLFPQEIANNRSYSYYASEYSQLFQCGLHYGAYDIGSDKKLQPEKEIRTYRVAYFVQSYGLLASRLTPKTRLELPTDNATAPLGGVRSRPDD